VVIQLLQAMSDALMRVLQRAPRFSDAGFRERRLGLHLVSQARLARTSDASNAHGQSACCGGEKTRDFTNSTSLALSAPSTFTSHPGAAVSGRPSRELVRTASLSVTTPEDVVSPARMRTRQSVSPEIKLLLRSTTAFATA